MFNDQAGKGGDEPGSSDNEKKVDYPEVFAEKSNHSVLLSRVSFHLEIFIFA